MRIHPAKWVRMAREVYRLALPLEGRFTFAEVVRK